MRIVVCSPQVPFARGGAEILAESLVRELRRREHEVALVTRDPRLGDYGVPILTA